MELACAAVSKARCGADVRRYSARKKPVKVSPAAVVSTTSHGMAGWSKRTPLTSATAPRAPKVSTTPAAGNICDRSARISSGSALPVSCMPSTSFTKKSHTRARSHSEMRSSNGLGLRTIRRPRAEAASMICGSMLTSFCKTMTSPSPKPSSTSSMYVGVTDRLAPPNRTMEFCPERSTWMMA